MGAFRDVEHEGDDRVVEDWDTGEWVDVGPDGRWHPSASDRTRALVVLGAIVGVLLLVGAVLSVGDDDEDDVVASTTSSSTTEPSGTSTTELPDPTSVGGEPPPEKCTLDDRGGAPLRDPGAVNVLVRNGTPVGGLAGSVSDELEAKGYATHEPGNADVRQTTSVQYRSGSCAEAHRLLGELAIADADLDVLPQDAGVFLGTIHILVTLGRDSL